jgi:hypothetical protein
MGRLVSPSKPKIKSPPQQVVYVTSPASPSPAKSAPSAPADAAPDEQNKTDDQISAEKAENLLRRNRSRLGTVLTSFRGILGQNGMAASRKTLLGE